MPQIDSYVKDVNKTPSEPSIVVCIGAHNEEAWIEPCILDIYDEVDRIIIVEGAVLGRPNADKNGHSTDGTVDRIFDISDPQDKVEIIQQDRHWKTLEEQKQQFLNLCKEGDWLLIKDADEIWNPKDIRRLRKAIKMYPNATEFVPIFLHFWGDTNVVKRYEKKWNICHQRFFKWQSGMRYLSHPIATDAQGVDTCLSPQYQASRYTIPDMYVYHYGYCKDLEFQKAKMDFYESELKKHNNAHLEHRKKFEEHYDGTFDPKSLLHFTGEHPEIMKDHPIMDYKYPHFENYDKFDDWKSDSIYAENARIPLIPNLMLPDDGKQPYTCIYKELRFLE